jgi:hypothetical protein
VRSALSPQEENIIKKSLPGFAKTDGNAWTMLFEGIVRKHEWLAAAVVSQKEGPKDPQSKPQARP